MVEMDIEPEIIEEVGKLKKEGFKDSQIKDNLENIGYSKQEIDQIMIQASIRKQKGPEKYSPGSELEMPALAQETGKKAPVPAPPPPVALPAQQGPTSVPQQPLPTDPANLALEYEDELSALEGPSVQPIMGGPESYVPKPKTAAKPVKNAMPRAPSPGAGPQLPDPAPYPGQGARAKKKKGGGMKLLLSIIIWLGVFFILGVIFILALPKLGVALPFSI